MKTFVWQIQLGALLSVVSATVMALAPVESRTGVSRGVGEVHSYAETDRGQGPVADRNALLGLREVETLKQELSELRGLVETQAHEIQQLKKSQKDFYVDLDKRIGQLKSPKKSGANAAVISEVPTVSPKKKSSVEDTTTVEETETIEVLSTKPKPDNFEKETYDAAYELVKTKQYPEAVKALEDYLVAFKEGQHAPNAHYWIGEIHMVEWQQAPADVALLDKAAKAFSNIPAQFPKNPKVPDALLKLGIIEQEQGHDKAASDRFLEIKRRYPGTAAARIAETRLKDLKGLS